MCCVFNAHSFSLLPSGSRIYTYFLPCDVRCIGWMLNVSLYFVTNATKLLMTIVIVIVLQIRIWQHHIRYQTNKTSTYPLQPVCMIWESCKTTVTDGYWPVVRSWNVPIALTGLIWFTFYLIFFPSAVSVIVTKFLHVEVSKWKTFTPSKLCSSLAVVCYLFFIWFD